MARVAIALALCALLVAGGVYTQNTYTSPADAVAKTKDLSTLLAAVTAADLATTLSDSNAQFTVLAPTNTAFAAAISTLGINPVTLLQTGGGLLSYILKLHVIPGAALTADQLADGQVLTTLLGQNLKVQKSGSTVTFYGPTNQASVTTPNIKAGNSVVHIIDSVLVPVNVFGAPSGAPASAPSLAAAIAAYQKGLAPSPSK